MEHWIGPNDIATMITTTARMLATMYAVTLLGTGPEMFNLSVHVKP
jgi:hypothetical protein